MNPEFQRNLWLEASPRRVAWAGVVLALIFGVVILVTSKHGAMAAGLAITGTFVFVVCGVLWGARAAGSAVLAEISDRTWDFQRLSAITPWNMTWGKMFGAASLAWLCGLAGLIVAILAGFARAPEDRSLSGVIFLLALAVLLQAAMMVAALIGVRKARAEGRIARSGGIVWGLIFGFFLLSSLASTLGIRGGVGLLGTGRMFNPPASVEWWGVTLAGDHFRAAATTAFALWALAGAWRLMRLELQMRNTPLVWPGFLLFLAIFTGGVFFTYGLSPALMAGSFTATLCAYAAAFAEPADRVRLRQFLAGVQRGRLDRAAPLTPMTLAPFAVALVLMLAALAIGPLTSGSDNYFEIGPLHGIAVLAFLARDLGAIAYFRFGPRPQRGDFSAVLGIALLYTVGGLVGGVFGGENGAAYFVPISTDPLVSFGSGLAQAAIAWWLAAKRFRSIEAPSPVPAATTASS